jgi:hypothetical protein
VAGTASAAVVRAPDGTVIAFDLLIRTGDPAPTGYAYDCGRFVGHVKLPTVTLAASPGCSSSLVASRHLIPGR